jgi:UDP-N-acetylmuramate--alanine ligase
LARLFNAGRGLAVAGAHGKTTTSAMLALIYHMESLEPNIVLGGILPQIGSNAQKGDSDIWVVEADESDGSFLKLHPHRTIITNIEPEHMNYYRTEANLENSFCCFAAQSDDLILCLDDRRTRELAEKCGRAFYSYGLEHRAVDLTVKNIRMKGLSSDSEVYFKGEKVVELHLGVPGIHNISNALAAMYAAYLGGISFDQAAAHLSAFTGTGRRFEILYDNDGVVIVDDYAHHPTEVRATIKAAKDSGFDRVIAVFQPHRYSRVKELYKEFGDSFGDADVIIIDDIYSAWEDQIEGVSSRMIVDEIEKQGLNALYFGDKQKLIDYLAKNKRSGDILLLMGAGNIRRTSEKLRDILLGE